MAMKKLGPDKKKGMKADAARKTKEAQSMGMGKVKAVKSAIADTKRKTAEAKSFPPAKKAPSSYALGLTPKAKKGGMGFPTAAQLKPVTKPAMEQKKKKSRP